MPKGHSNAVQKIKSLYTAAPPVPAAAPVLRFDLRFAGFALQLEKIRFLPFDPVWTKRIVLGLLGHSLMMRGRF